MGLFSKKKVLPFAGALFNLNGVIVDTERLSEQAWWNVLARRGLRFQDYTDEWHAGLLGHEYFRVMMEFFGINESIDGFADEWQREADALILEHAKLCPGVLKVIKDLRKYHTSLGIVTESSVKMSNRLLQKFGLSPYFSRLITKEWLLQNNYRGKPTIDPYITAAYAMDLNPGRCIAFENTVNGVTSAKHAGIPIIYGVINYPTEGEAKIRRKYRLLEGAGATWTFQGLEDFCVKDLLTTF